MLTTALRHCGARPRLRASAGSSPRPGWAPTDGTGEMFVAEADESDGSFLHAVARRPPIVTNVEADHLDNYAGLAEIEDDLRRVRPPDQAGRAAGRLRGRPGRARTGRGRRAAARSGSAPTARRPSADYRVTGVAPRGMGVGLARVRRGRAAGAPSRRGCRSAYPAVTTRSTRPPRIAAARRARPAAPAAGRRRAGRLPRCAAPDGAQGRGGRGHACSTATPTIRPSSPPTCARRATSRAGGRVIAVFQPHLFSRTRIFAAEFGAALGLADEVFVLDVYAAREDPNPG